MSQDSRRFLVWGGVAVGVVVAIVVAGWYVLSRLNAMVDDVEPQDRPAPRVREYKPRRVVKVYGPIARPTRKAPPRTVPDQRAEPPERYVPPRYRFVFRKAPPQAPPGAPRFPPLTNAKFYTISRKKFAEWANLPVKEMGGRFEPNFQYGRLQGVKITGLAEQTFFRRLGLYREDVLLKVNGKRVVAPGHMRKIFQKIARGYRNITLEFRRGSEVKTVDFSLK